MRVFRLFVYPFSHPALLLSLPILSLSLSYSFLFSPVSKDVEGDYCTVVYHLSTRLFLFLSFSLPSTSSASSPAYSSFFFFVVYLLLSFPSVCLPIHPPRLLPLFSLPFVFLLLSRFSSLPLSSPFNFLFLPTRFEILIIIFESSSNVSSSSPPPLPSVLSPSSSFFLVLLHH